MVRQLRVEFSRAIYHVTVRMLGDWKKEENRLFEDDADRMRFLESLAARVEQFQIRLFAFACIREDEFRKRRRISPWRGIAGHVLVRFSGMTQRQAADVLEAGTGSGVGAQMRKVQDWMKKDARLKYQFE